MRKNQAIAGLLAAVLCTGGLAACGDDDSGPESSGNGGAATSTAAGASSGGIDSSKPEARFALVSMDVPGLEQMPAMKAGADAAAAEINAKGGIGGRKVVIDSCNSQVQPAVTTTCARKLVAKKPIAQFGCEVSWSAAGLPIFAKAGVPSFNCSNTAEDFKNPMAFGINAGGYGEQRATAKFLCERDDIQKVTMITLDIPQQRRDSPAAVEPVIKECGKQIEFEYAPMTAADLAINVNRAMKNDPDFIITYLPAKQTTQLFKAFKQAGYPADQVSAPSSSFGYKEVLEPAGDLVEGAYSGLFFSNWSDTSDPSVAAYLKAMEGSSIDARAALPQWGYQSVMWFYTVAEKVGFDTFDSAALTEFMNTQTDVDMPLSRKLVNPGPKGYPQMKQPYTQIVQWKDGKLNTITEGTDDGWVTGF